LTKVPDLTDNEKLYYISGITDKFVSAMQQKGIKQGQLGLKLNYLFEVCKMLTGKCVDVYTIQSDPH